MFAAMRSTPVLNLQDNILISERARWRSSVSLTSVCEQDVVTVIRCTVRRGCFPLSSSQFTGGLPVLPSDLPCSPGTQYAESCPCRCQERPLLSVAAGSRRPKVLPPDQFVMGTHDEEWQHRAKQGTKRTSCGLAYAEKS